ncbi:hypothetical protein AAKU52_000304 [Pedobacter sp. CG_S7]|uniref:hypothetical protein n=1 Tax=Pedobacter sp. CG_S7 TaxID=3143930 RepID=UPI003391669E
MKNLMLFLLFTCIGSYAFSQRPTDRRDEIESYRVAYLTQRMELSLEEAKIFWPIYKRWQDEQQVLRKVRGQKMISYRKIEDIETLSDSEVQSLIANELNIKQKALNIDKKYYNLLKSSLPIKIVGKYYRAQETFKKELFNRYREGKRN